MNRQADTGMDEAIGDHLGFNMKIRIDRNHKVEAQFASIDLGKNGTGDGNLEGAAHWK